MWKRRPAGEQLAQYSAGVRKEDTVRAQIPDDALELYGHATPLVRRGCLEIFGQRELRASDLLYALAVKLGDGRSLLDEELLHLRDDVSRAQSLTIDYLARNE